MRWLAALAIALPLTAAASAPVPPPAVPLDRALALALDEQRSAAAAAARLEEMADKARGSAEKLAARQAAAGEELAGAEAGITASDARLRLAMADLAAHRMRLAREQKPAASLLAGLALMARQPPLLALADHGSVDELVRIRVLIRSTIPAIRARTAGLARLIEQGEQLADTTAKARTRLADSRRDLIAKRTQFAQLERRALDAAAQAEGGSLSAGDAAIAAGEDVERLRSGQSSARAASALAGLLAAESPPPPRPVAGEETARGTAFAYQLPASAPVTNGLGAVNASGVRSRGLTLATRRGTVIVAPAAGTVRFAGPFRDYDGVIIIDHGGGWLTLIVNSASAVGRGGRVAAGQPIGRALGPIQVELSQNGRPISPALIAGSSRGLSNMGKDG